MNASTTPMLDHRFLVLDAIGRGGQGRVFRAFDRERERVVALKILHDENAAPGPGHPLAEEFAAWARLRHRRIVRAFELRRAASSLPARSARRVSRRHLRYTSPACPFSPWSPARAT